MDTLPPNKHISTNSLKIKVMNSIVLCDTFSPIQNYLETVPVDCLNEIYDKLNIIDKKSFVFACGHAQLLTLYIEDYTRLMSNNLSNCSMVGMIRSNKELDFIYMMIDLCGDKCIPEHINRHDQTALITACSKGLPDVAIKLIERFEDKYGRVHL